MTSSLSTHFDGVLQSTTNATDNGCSATIMGNFLGGFEALHERPFKAVYACTHEKIPAKRRFITALNSPRGIPHYKRKTYCTGRRCFHKKTYDENVHNNEGPTEGPTSLDGETPSSFSRSCDTQPTRRGLREGRARPTPLGRRGGAQTPPTP